MDLSELPARPTARHPWEVVRAEFFERLTLAAVRAARTAGAAAPVRLLDVGAGDAWFARRVAESDPRGLDVVCWDTAYTDAQLTESVAPNLRRVRERPAGTFDVVTALDVIEHVKDDDGFVAELVAFLAPATGRLVASVPAYQSLYSRHDEQLGHFRRYSPAQFRALLRRAGLRIEGSGNLFHSLFAVRAASMLAQRAVRRREQDGRFELTWDRGALVTALVTNALRLDAGVGRTGAPLPGLSTWAACRR